jgi:ribonuclease BN (tRNA processing enzyme)
MKITLLGTGTPHPSLKRASSGYMVEVGTDVLLFDHGPGAFQRLLESGMAPTRVTHLFFTHLHYDHCLDYARLLLQRWDQGAGSIPELRVCGPSGTAHMTEALIAPEGAFGPDLRARCNHAPSVEVYRLRGGKPPRNPPRPLVQEIESGARIEGDGWSVRAVAVPHAQPYLECLGLRLDTPEGSFAYSGDAGPSNAFARLCEDVDVLVHMCYQISGSIPEEWAKGAAGHLEVARIAREARARSLVISHISTQMDIPGVRERLIREMAAIYDGTLYWGEDNMTIPVHGPQAAAHRG